MGSNSFRLVAYSYEPGRWWRRTDEIYDTVRLGAGLVATGRLAEDRIETAIEAMEVYAHFCAASGIAREQVIAVATSAIRDAANGAELLARVRERTGFPARVLSAEEEARYGYLAAVNSTSLRDGAVLDLGGGSLQIVAVADRLAVQSASWPLGTVRMTERFLDGRRSGAKQRDALRAHVLEELGREPWVARTRGSLVGIGGTVRNLAAAAGAAAGLPSIGVQGALLERDALEQLIEELASRSVGQRAAIEGIKPGRAGLILAGAVVIAAAMEAVGAERMRGHPFGPPRGRLLLQPPRGRGPAAVRRRPRRERAQPGGPVPARPRALHARRRPGRPAPELFLWRAVARRRIGRPASCYGRRGCSTTSAWRSTTTTTTSTLAT